MILTGKCKVDFGNQSVLDYYDFIRLNETIQYAMIIEWFDSVKITIDRDSYNNRIIITEWYDEKQTIVECDEFHPFNEWWKQAIIKTNEIYNEKRNII